MNLELVKSGDKIAVPGKLGSEASYTIFNVVRTTKTQVIATLESNSTIEVRFNRNGNRLGGTESRYRQAIPATPEILADVAFQKAELTRRYAAISRFHKIPQAAHLLTTAQMEALADAWERTTTPVSDVPHSANLQDIQVGNVISICKDGKKTYRVKVTGLTDRLLTTTFTNPEVNHSLMFNRETGQELGVNDGYRIVPDTNESSNNL